MMNKPYLYFAKHFFILQTIKQIQNEKQNNKSNKGLKIHDEITEEEFEEKKRRVWERLQKLIFWYV